jgi:glycosyltransferase involved in cell wall biosynthesis
MEAPLRRFLEKHANARLLVVSDRPPTFPAVPRGKVCYIPWSMAGEADALREMHVGLMPLPDTEWTRGKCSFKMLQYMATGIPAVVSPLGMNREILDMGSVGIGAADDDSWYEALSLYHGDPQRREADGREGRTIAEQKFGKYIVAEALSGIFRELA